MITLISFVLILLVITAAFTKFVMHTFEIKKRYVPATHLVVGIIFGILARPFTDLGVELRFWAGAFTGLISAGLLDFETFKMIFLKKKGGK